MMTHPQLPQKVRRRVFRRNNQMNMKQEKKMNRFLLCTVLALAVGGCQNTAPIRSSGKSAR